MIGKQTKLTTWIYVHLALLLVAKNHVYSNDIISKISNSTINDVLQPRDNVYHNGIFGNVPIIEIDLGSTQSCVALFKNGYAKSFSNDLGHIFTPSYVSFFGNATDTTVGKYAYRQAVINPESTVFDVKRLIGRKYSDWSTQADEG